MIKHATTHNNRVGYVTRLSAFAVAILMMIAAPIAYTDKAFADQYDNQLSALRAQADQYQAQANELRAKADTLQNKLDEITAQKSAIEARISISQTRHDQLVQEIAQNEKKMGQAQDVLGDTLASLYVDGKISSLELLASSHNVGDFIDKQEYRSSVRDELKKSIDTIKALKKKLDADRKDLEKVLADLATQNAQLAATQAEQARLVEQTRGEEAAYQQLVNSTRSQMAEVTSQQQAYYQSLVSKGGGGNSGVIGSFSYSNLSPSNGAGGCSGGYPYCQAQDTMVDPWNLYNRECVSYVAWALEKRFNKKVNPFRGDGNATDWPVSAVTWSGAMRVYSPQRGDVVVLPASGSFAPIGHVMIVESVSGNTMFVSQYNFYGTGQYSTMNVQNSGVVLLRFQNR
ncbi:TPA: CHAP domain-containing protein [Candidatus Saccharibacteria bacterium]|nr:MAG: exported protein of unknown function [Candidatus Saccharibacteria bacterium GW2011_GWC2_44_17]OGL23101.1 MAG: hypothetical protein A2791_05490 [Candidatus Saccharibacteria bacterium RIFCSPHIGHO2_01_FULL_46_30]OGL34138.1 MAG: hypothetical protein A3E20_04525 [Candidatus Saccharibacteria bacterium RIFCSPHIGHO2_12_FULL_47_16]HBH78056.1 CHAP domain-containing protein [Candidatus Saccharibacteria bacterium]